jgi:plastocyanin
VDSTVTWSNQDVSARHSATSDNGSFDTGLFNPGGQRSITFTTPGNFPYYCILHGDAGGSGMAAILIVKE